MTTFVAEVRVMLKPSVNDPQGLSVRNALKTLAFKVDDVRVGKLIRVTVQAADQSDADRVAREMCERLLANPVIETYEFTLNEAPAPAP